MDQELQNNKSERPSAPMSRPVFKSAQSTRGFGVDHTKPVRVSRAADIERIVAACVGRGAELETSGGVSVALEFAPPSRVHSTPGLRRVTASAIAFRVREDSLVPTLASGTISFEADGVRYSFRADVTRGNDGLLHASFPSRLY